MTEEYHSNVLNPDISELESRETVDVILLFPRGIIRESKMKSRNVNETIGLEQGISSPRFFVKSKLRDPERPSLWIYELKHLKLASFLSKIKGKKKGL